MLVLLNIISFAVLAECYGEMDSDTFIIIFTKLRNFKFVYSMHFQPNSFSFPKPTKYT